MQAYTLNPEQISLQLFYKMCSSKNMIPSRVALKDGIDSHFRVLESKGIENLKQLNTTLGNREKIGRFATESGIPESYLILLKREAGSYLARPFPLSEFPGVPLEYTEVLKSRGIRNTREFFESVQSAEQRVEMAKRTGIPASRLTEIFILCDLSRITGVGGIYARIVYHAGIRSVRQFAETNPAKHNELYLESLEKLGYPVRALGEEDLLYCISYASLIAKLNANPDHP